MRLRSTAPRRHPRGFIIFGTRTRLVPDGSGSIQAQCPACHRPARIDGMKAQQWFTLYFIPVFPMGSGTRFTQCAACRAQFRANLQEMQRMLGGASRAGVAPPPQPGARPSAAAAQASGFPQAIALFNAMRQTPEDSAKLAQLLQMYLSMNEPGEAISAGREYPKAMGVSDACCSLMSQAFLQLGDRAAAARHAAAALALNPGNGKALALQGQALATG